MPRRWNPSLIVTFDPIVEPIGVSDVEFPVSQAQQNINKEHCRNLLHDGFEPGNAPHSGVPYRLATPQLDTTRTLEPQKTKPNCKSVGL